jgi:deoxyribose-phosphate aldolase
VIVSREQLAKAVDHTLLKPDASRKDIMKLCAEAKKYEFASVCVNPTYVSLAARILKKTNVRVSTVIDFPFGATTSEVKTFETRNAVSNGAQEFDMVMNIGALKSGNYRLVVSDIKSVVSAAKRIKNPTIKVILETGFLTDKEKVIACKLAMKADADFVKTSTGFGPEGAKIRDVRLLRNTVGRKLGVKASGGIRTLERAMAMLNAGADRIGTSSGVAIVESFKV